MSNYVRSSGPMERAFFECRDSLDRLTRVLLSCLQGGTTLPTRYEADMAASYLLSCTWLHANALSHLAEIPYTGSHLIPAQALCRAAVESGFTALWLLDPDDWRQREARWLRYVRREEKHRHALSVDFSKLSPQMTERLASECLSLQERRRKISELLLAEFAPDSVIPDIDSIPSFARMLQDLDEYDKIYIRYRFLSHSVHGGPSQASTAMRTEGHSVSMYMAHSPQEWSVLFSLTGYAVYAGLESYTKRVQIPESKLVEAREALHEVMENSDSLANMFELTRSGGIQ